MALATYDLAYALCAGRGVKPNLKEGLMLFEILLKYPQFKHDAFLKLMEYTQDPKKIVLLVSDHCNPQPGIHHRFDKYHNPAVYRQVDILCQIMADKGGVSYQMRVAENTKSQAEAAHYFGLAAEQGNSQAQHELGKMVAKGMGVPKDEIRAVGLFRLAAEKENPDAQLSLAIMLLDGKGVEKNRAEAFRLLRQAAPKNRQAIHLLENYKE